MEGDPVLIALHSVKGAGKDTTFGFIQEWCAEQSEPAPSAVKRGFADKAKWAYARQFFPTISEPDAIKWVDKFKDTKCHVRGPDLDGGYVEVPFRKHMAQFATEGAREVYGCDFWVDQVLPLEVNEHNPEGWRGNFLVPPTEKDLDEGSPYGFATYAVITDMRFDNETERVKALGGLRVKIRRRDAEKVVIEEAEREGREVHISDLLLPDDQFDVVLINDDNSMERSRDRTRFMLNEIKNNGVASIQAGRPLPWSIGY